MPTNKIQIIGQLIPDVATADKDGLMSSADKIKLDSIEAGATNTVIDDILDGTSINPIQNKAVKEALDQKSDVGHSHPQEISAHNTSATAHNDIRVLIEDLITKLENFLDIDDVTTDQLSEVITLINNNKDTLESLTTSKINISAIIDNLTTNSANKVLSAAQGVVIKGLIDALQTEVNGKVPTSRTVNGKALSSNISLSASDVGALSSSTKYAGSSSAGGSATSAAKLDSSAGSSTQPVYFSNGKPVKTTYTLEKSVPSDAKFTDTTYSAAGSSLGLVKSGGDVTISDGVIAVNDDSHNHTISNVDNLQSSLDGKLSLSGGTMTGAITVSSPAASMNGGKIDVPAGASRLYANALAISNPALNTDCGWIRVLGTGEDDTVLEIATSDDAGASGCEKIAVRQYDYSTNEIGKEAVLLDRDGSTSFPGSVTAPSFNGNLNGNASSADTISCLTKRTDTNGETWGSQAGTCLGEWKSANGGGLQLRENNPESRQLSLLLDGTVYVKEGTYEVIHSGNIGSQSVNYATTADSATKATQDASGNTITSTYATKSELNTAKSSLQSSIDGKAASSHTHSYAGSSSAGGAATSANKLNTNAGTAHKPVYFSNGVPVQCTAVRAYEAQYACMDEDGYNLTDHAGRKYSAVYPGSEIFNCYDTNKCTSNYSTAMGKGNWAWQLCELVIGSYNSHKTYTNDNERFVVGNGYIDSSNSEKRSNALVLTNGGECYISGSYHNGGADYAEYFEWEDGNPNNEDRRGYFVTMVGKKIKIAKSDDYILGIISGQPSVVGNSDMDWQGRYLKDEFGAYIMEVVDCNEDVFDEETGEITTVTKAALKRKENPEYDPTRIHMSRGDRPEWDAVGMIGVLAVRDDGTCQVNGYCEVAEGGTATASETGYRVIARVTDNIVQIIFK